MMNNMWLVEFIRQSDDVCCSPISETRKVEGQYHGNQQVCYLPTFLLFWYSWKGFLTWWLLWWSSSLCFLTFLTCNDVIRNHYSLSYIPINTHPPFPCPTLHPKDPSFFSGSLPPPQWNQWHSYHHPKTSLHREREEGGREKNERGKEVNC